MSDRREALHQHVAAVNGRWPQGGHSDSGFSTCASLPTPEPTKMLESMGLSENIIVLSKAPEPKEK